MTLKEYFGDWIKVIDLNVLGNTIKEVNNRYNKCSVMPNYKDIFRAFTLCNLPDVKIVMIGQDPYPQKNVATGLAFGNRSYPISPSLEVLKNAVVGYDSMEEVRFDITLEAWAKQGVLLLNYALTVEENNPGSHTNLWRPFTTSLIESLSNYNAGIIYILLGSDAWSLEPYIGKFNIILKEKHPSWYVRTSLNMPHKIFAEADRLMVEKYGEPIKWYNND